jgi:hypothetical protein
MCERSLKVAHKRREIIEPLFNAIDGSANVP